MRVGYEAKRAFSNTTGLGNYARTLMGNVARACPQWQFYLFTPTQKIAWQESLTNAHIITPPPSWPSVAGTLWRSFALSGEAKKLSLDIFHGLSHELAHGMHRNTCSVVTVHDLIYLLRPSEFQWIDRQIYDYKLRYATRHAHHILTFSEHTKKNLLQYFKIKESKITIMPQSCHPAFLQSYSAQELADFSKKYQLPRPYMHFVGSFVARKKPLETLMAFQEIAPTMDIDLVMIGQGPEKSRCQSFVQAKGLSQRVHFLCPQSPQEMAQCAQGSQLLVYPSVEEGFGIPLIEAHFSRTPVLTSPYSCLPEIAGKHAYYADPDRRSEFVATLQFALEHSPESQERAASAWKWAQRFSPDVVTKQLVEFYRSL